MKITYFGYSNKKSLLNSIIFLVLGIILFTNPGEVVNFISIVVGITFGIIGLMNIINYHIIKKKLNIENKLLLYSGVALIILGIVSAFLATLIETVLRLLIGAFIIYNGIMRLIDSLNHKTNFASLLIRLIVAILIILGGLYILLSINLVYKTIGLFIIIYTILDIVGYITFYKKGTS